VDRLGVRLALVIGIAVAILIVVVGLALNTLVGNQFNQYVEDEQASRRAQLAAALVETYRETGSLAIPLPQARELASVAGGQIIVYDAGGRVVARSSRVAPVLGQVAGTISVPLVDGDTRIGRLDVVPSSIPPAVRAAASDAFRRALDITLIVAGLVAVAGAIVVALVMALRLTRPLGEMASAARRVGGGDLSARVPVPGDREGRDLALAFNGMAEELQRSEVLRRQAASDLAHEIATPVTVLATQLDAMADGVLPADPAHIAAARETAGEVARLVGDLHDLAAAEGAALHRTPERVDLVALAAQVAAANLSLYRQRQVALEGPVPAAHAESDGTAAPPTTGGPATTGEAPGGVAPAGVSVPVIADPRQIERALGNLVTNAAMYTPPGGRVQVTVSTEGRWARIRVADTGPGIAPAHAERVFERFYRADPARSRTPGVPGGTGIGLTVARELARANGGDVRIEHTSPAGTTFVLELTAAR